MTDDWRLTLPQYTHNHITKHSAPKMSVRVQTHITAKQRETLLPGGGKRSTVTTPLCFAQVFLRSSQLKNQMPLFLVVLCLSFPPLRSLNTLIIKQLAMRAIRMEVSWEQELYSVQAHSPSPGTPWVREHAINLWLREQRKSINKLT